MSALLAISLGVLAVCVAIVASRKEHDAADIGGFMEQIRAMAASTDEGSKP